MAPIRLVDMQVIESVLGMGGGFVLPGVLSDAKFTQFFAEHGVNIDDAQYMADGDSNSKAKRMRRFLSSAAPELAANVLEGLLELRLIEGGLDPNERDLYQKVVARLRGGQTSSAATQAPSNAEDELMKRAFDPAKFGKLPVDGPIAKLLVDRMEEAQRNLASSSFLSAIIMCGSVLEAMCLGYGNQRMKDVNVAYAKRYGKTPPLFREWKLVQWIEVLEDLGVFQPTIATFGQGLREFRNFIHPGEQLAAGFNADAHAARISFHVVVAAAEDILRALQPPAGVV
jgi:hypothetical protein